MKKKTLSELLAVYVNKIYAKLKPPPSHTYTQTYKHIQAKRTNKQTKCIHSMSEFFNKSDEFPRLICASFYVDALTF